MNNEEQKPAVKQTDALKVPASAEDKPQRVSIPVKAASRWNRFRDWYKNNKKLSIPATVVVVLLVLGIIPISRYAMAGLFISHDVQVQVLDSKTSVAVSDANVRAGSGMAGTTNGSGYATLHKVKPGSTVVNVSKKYYKAGEVKTTVSVFNSSKAIKVPMQATGRQVKVTLTNVITKKPLADVNIKIADITAKTDKSGNATLVLPADAATQKAVLKLTGYNDASITVQVSDTDVKQNNFSLTPTGRVYFLSNRTGKLDVMKANLDGSDPKVVLAGTGTEDINSTILIASPDWKYLALLANREGGRAKVYVISTIDDHLNTADEGNADFSLSGWLGDNLVYTVTSADLSSWQTGASKLKNYNADTAKLTLLDQTTGSGDATSNVYEFYNFVFLSGDTVVYDKDWTSQSYSTADFTGKQQTLASISVSGQNHKVVAQYDAATKTADFAPHSANAVYILQNDIGSSNFTYYDYVIGSAPKQIALTTDQFYKSYPTYYESPDSKQTLWTEKRDGKNAVLVDDSNGDNGTQVASLSEHVPYGWFSGGYILVSKQARELAIIGSGGGEPLKITDYQGSSYFETPPTSVY